MIVICVARLINNMDSSQVTSDQVDCRLSIRGGGISIHSEEKCLISALNIFHVDMHPRFISAPAPLGVGQDLESSTISSSGKAAVEGC